jgi:hypothetical protein
VRFFGQSRAYVVTKRAPHRDLHRRRPGLATGLAGERRRSDGATFRVSIAPGRYSDAHAAAGTDDVADAGPHTDAQGDLVSPGDTYALSKREPFGQPER